MKKTDHRRSPILFVLFWGALSLPPVSASEPKTDRVDALFAEWDRADSPGCALGVMQNGRFLYQRGYGMANLEHDIPISSSTVFRIGSVSKQFSAFALILAASEGRLSLDDEIHQHLPELRRYDQPVTLRHLLHHTSGMRDYLVLMRLSGKRDEDYYTDEEVMEALSRLHRLNFPPGDEYLYSNSGYFLISQIIPRVTGKSLREWAEEKMFQPLGMTSTHFHDDPRMIVKRRASGYRPRKNGGGFELDMTTLEMVGDGGIFTSIDDLLEWEKNFYDDTPGGPEVMNEMLTTGVLNDGTRQNYASGLVVSTYRGLEVVRHGGSFVGFRAAMLRFPEERFAIYCLCNLSSIRPMELAAGVAETFLADELEPMSDLGIELPAARLQELTGVYWNDRKTEVVDVVFEEGALEMGRDSKDALRPVDESRFVARSGLDETRVWFYDDSDGAKHMEVRSEGQRPFVYRRVQPVAMTEEELEAYVGIYFCEELDATYRVHSGEDGNLLFEVSPLPEQVLKPVFPDAFRWEDGTLIFERLPSGVVDGFRLQVGRARNFVFTPTNERAE